MASNGKSLKSSFGGRNFWKVVTTTDVLPYNEEIAIRPPSNTLLFSDTANVFQEPEILSFSKTRGTLRKSTEDYAVKIASKGFMPLCIEKHGKMVTVTHYFEQNGDLIADPDMSSSISAAKTGCHLSPGYLSKLETGLKPITLEMRNRLMTAYGYSPSSFKNLCTDPVRSKVVPLMFKLRILLNQLSEPQIESVFHYIQDLTSRKETSKSSGGSS